MRHRVINPADHRLFSSIKELEAAAIDDACTVTVMLGGLPIDIRYEPRGYPTTLVMFGAAVTRTMRFPIFAGDGLTAPVPANRIFVNDPSLYIDDRLTLAWYAGNARQPRLQLAIKRILTTLTMGTDVVTFGVSGGGFAALYYATVLGGAAVPVNPQTNIAAYKDGAIRNFTQYGWSTTDLDKVPAVTDLVKLYSQPVPNRTVYIQNTGDTEHMTQHYAPFMGHLHPDNNVRPVLVAGGHGHVRPPKELMTSTLTDVVGKQD